MEATHPGEGSFDDVRVQRPNRNRGWNIRKRRRDYYIPVSIGEVGVPRVAPLMHIMKNMVPSVLVFVTTLRYGGKPQTMLLENPASMWCFIAATCVYWLTVGEIKQMATTGIRFQIYRGTALASGILSSVLIVSMLLIRPLSIWIPLVMAPLILLFTAYSLLYRGIKCLLNKMRVVVVVAWARGLREPPALPV